MHITHLDSLTSDSKRPGARKAKKAGEKVESFSQTERLVVEVGLQALAEAFEASTQTEDSSENTDVDTADEVQVKQLLQMTQQLRGMLDFRSGSSRETLTETLQRMLEVLDGKKMPRKAGWMQWFTCTSGLYFDIL